MAMKKKNCVPMCNMKTITLDQRDTEAFILASLNKKKHLVLEGTKFYKKTKQNFFFSDTCI